MSIRLYIGNLPQTFEEQELVALLKSVGEGIRFKSVLDRETGACRGFGFANVDDPKLADAVIEALNGKNIIDQNPNKPTSPKATAQGNRNATSRSKMMNRIATR